MERVDFLASQERAFSFSPKRIRINLAYEGTHFVGWQIQPKGRSIQGELERVLFQVLGEKMSVVGSGRTDSGVHALYQVAHFDLQKPTSIEPPEWEKVFNSLLPKDIRVLASEEVSFDFHARFSAVERVYRYLLLPKENEGQELPFARSFCWATKMSHNLNRLNQYASFLIGKHDFSAFCASGDKSKSKERIITSAAFAPKGNYIFFRIAGNAFLWKMVRSIVGTLVELDQKEEDPMSIKNFLEKNDKKIKKVVAPAAGLFLERVRYTNEAGGTGFEYE